MHYDVVIVGAGPGGLQCGRILAENGARTLILERSKRIGAKVCAGGITWRGLITAVPAPSIERSFTMQLICTRYQKTVIEEPDPLVATVNRIVLASHMARQAEQAGADIITGAAAERFEGNRLYYRSDGKRYQVSFDFLVGADGSNSLVRKVLGLPVERLQRGIGMHYVVDDPAPRDMVWNFDSALFKSGYSWIFPRRGCSSVGAYVGIPVCSAQRLKAGLDRWLCGQQIDVSRCRLQAGQINWAYRGWRFGSVFLVGDAAGLASPLTGEGINPAFVSGETVARTIIDPDYECEQLTRIIRRHRSHKNMLKTATKSPMVSTVLSEICAVLLRYRLIGFDRFEMA
ncbi:MAG: NAD(P)/FAD-dependent oxidoreductase [Desulfofustis sp.]|nr:NAD(P)/FAD-dependent oxidoreductase [Desulfofustis sp.]